MKDSGLYLMQRDRVRSSFLALIAFLTPAANIFSLRALFFLYRLKSIAAIAFTWWVGGAALLGTLATASHYFLVMRPVSRLHQECDGYLKSASQQTMRNFETAGARRELEAIVGRLEHVLDSTNCQQGIRDLRNLATRLLARHAGLKTQINTMRPSPYNGPDATQGWVRPGERVKAAGVGLTSALCIGGVGFTAFHLLAGWAPVAAAMAGIPVVGWGVLAGLAIMGVAVAVITTYRAATREFAQANQRRASLDVDETLKEKREPLEREAAGIMQVVSEIGAVVSGSQQVRDTSGLLKLYKQKYADLQDREKSGWQPTPSKPIFIPGAGVGVGVGVVAGAARSPIGLGGPSTRFFALSPDVPGKKAGESVEGIAPELALMH